MLTKLEIKVLQTLRKEPVAANWMPFKWLVCTELHLVGRGLVAEQPAYVPRFPELTTILPFLARFKVYDTLFVITAEGRKELEKAENFRVAHRIEG